MATLFWRPLPIFTLTIRQFLGGKAVRVVTVLALVPCAFAGIYLLNPDIGSQRSFLTNDIFLDLVAPTLLPVTVLILATGALGNEIEDRTLPYLTLKPISRLRIIVEKLLGVLTVVMPTILGGLLLTYLIVTRGSAGDSLRLLGAMLAAAAAEIVTVSAIFMFVSLIIPRALLAGIIYTFVWESLLGSYLPGTYVVSIHHYVDAIFAAISKEPDAISALKYPTTLTSALLTLGITSLVAIVLSTWRLRRMNLE